MEGEHQGGSTGVVERKAGAGLSARTPRAGARPWHVVVVPLRRTRTGVTVPRTQPPSRPLARLRCPVVLRAARRAARVMRAARRPGPPRALAREEAAPAASRAALPSAAAAALPVAGASALPRGRSTAPATASAGWQCPCARGPPRGQLVWAAAARGTARRWLRVIAEARPRARRAPLRVQQPSVCRERGLQSPARTTAWRSWTQRSWPAVAAGIRPT
mmetsp:Transcript_23937/g.74527  ORF Transcript_23937/g.74527 Transcript_23937/m.74527 type:complete len:218 (+) Transcript_23937:383-1036(+)